MSWMVPLKEICASPKSWYLRMWPYVEIWYLQIQWNILRWNLLGLRVGLKSSNNVIIKERRGIFEMHRREPCGDRSRDKRIQLLPRNVKDCLQPSEARRGSWVRLFIRSFRRCLPCLYFDFIYLFSRKVR